MMGQDAMILVLLILSLKPDFSLSSRSYNRLEDRQAGKFIPLAVVSPAPLSCFYLTSPLFSSSSAWSLLFFLEILHFSLAQSSPPLQRCDPSLHLSVDLSQLILCV